MVASPLVGWALPSNRPAKICRASDLDANRAASLTLWLIQSFSGRKANQAIIRIGRPIANQTHFRRNNPISFSILDLIHGWRQGSIFGVATRDSAKPSQNGQAGRFHRITQPNQPYTIAADPAQGRCSQFQNRSDVQSAVLPRACKTWE